MHIVIWTIKVNEGTSRQDILYGIENSTPDYRGVAGLERIWFGISPDEKSLIEASLWQSKAAADKFFNAEWETDAMRHWQVAPMVRRDWEGLSVVDN